MKLEIIENIKESEYLQNYFSKHRTLEDKWAEFYNKIDRLDDSYEITIREWVVLNNFKDLTLYEVGNYEKWHALLTEGLNDSKFSFTHEKTIGQKKIDGTISELADLTEECINDKSFKLKPRVDISELYPVYLDEYRMLMISLALSAVFLFLSTVKPKMFIPIAIICTTQALIVFSSPSFFNRKSPLKVRIFSYLVLIPWLFSPILGAKFGVFHELTSMGAFILLPIIINDILMLFLWRTDPQVRLIIDRKNTRNMLYSLNLDDNYIFSTNKLPIKWVNFFFDNFDDDGELEHIMTFTQYKEISSSMGELTDYLIKLKHIKENKNG